MEPDDLRPDADPAAAPVIGAYLDELGSHLAVGRRTRRAILTEIADGLACAVADRIDRNEPPAIAAKAAIDEFGPARDLAKAFNRQLVLEAAHRTGLGLLLSGPLVGLSWLAAIGTSAGLLASINDMLSRVPVIAMILVVTVPAAVMATAGAGWPARRLQMPTRWVSGAIVVAAVGCAAGDTVLLSTAAMNGAGGLMVVGVVASAVRLSAVGWAMRRIVGLLAAAR